MLKIDTDRKKEILDELKKFPRDTGAKYENGKIASLLVREEELKYLESEEEIRIIDLKKQRYKRILLM